MGFIDLVPSVIHTVVDSLGVLGGLVHGIRVGACESGQRRTQSVDRQLEFVRHRLGVVEELILSSDLLLNSLGLLVRRSLSIVELAHHAVEESIELRAQVGDNRLLVFALLLQSRSGVLLSIKLHGFESTVRLLEFGLDSLENLLDIGIDTFHAGLLLERLEGLTKSVHTSLAFSQFGNELLFDLEEVGLDFFDVRNGVLELSLAVVECLGSDGDVTLIAVLHLVVALAEVGDQALECVDVCLCGHLSRVKQFHDRNLLLDLGAKHTKNIQISFGDTQSLLLFRRFGADLRTELLQHGFGVLGKQLNGSNVIFAGDGALDFRRQLVYRLFGHNDDSFDHLDLLLGSTVGILSKSEYLNLLSHVLEQDFDGVDVFLHGKAFWNHRLGHRRRLSVCRCIDRLLHVSDSHFDAFDIDLGGGAFGWLGRRGKVVLHGGIHCLNLDL